VSGYRSYGLAVLTTLAAMAVTRYTWPVFAGAPFAPLFAAVAATTHWGGGRAGLAAIALASLGAPLALPMYGARPWNPYTLFGFIPVALIGNRLIAGRNRAVAALRASEAELRATWQQAMRAQKMEAVGQLVAGVAHNFNNLLTVTMGYTDLLEEQHRQAGMDQSAVEEIRRATERGALLTRQLLAFGRKHDARLARIGLDRTVEGLRGMLARVIREDIELTINVEPGPLAVMIDPHDLEQVIFNLVINARDALPSGGAIHIDVGRERIDAANPSLDPAAAPGEYLRLRVRDNGIGMAPDVQSHLFEPFFTTKEVGEGTGLGLAFVHGIARHGGGFVSVQSAPAKGTTVSVYLPPAPEAERPAAVQPHAESTLARPSAATILLVEDDGPIRRMTAQVLGRAGYRVLSAASPGEACALFDEHGADIGLLLTDVVMPEMRGTALAERLIARRPDLPVLFVSGYSDTMPETTVALGRVSFLPKPFAPSRLVTTVAELLGAAAS
jgi:two-component system, cell cycle sensor histidine kinase and response regulator CckA